MRPAAAPDQPEAILVWDVAAARELAVLPGAEIWLDRDRAAFSPDGRCLLTLVRDPDTVGGTTVQVRDVDTGDEVLAPFSTHAGPVMSLAFSPEGKQLATSDWTGLAFVWDAGTGRLG